MTRLADVQRGTSHPDPAAGSRPQRLESSWQPAGPFPPEKLHRRLFSRFPARCCLRLPGPINPRDAGDSKYHRAAWAFRREALSRQGSSPALCWHRRAGWPLRRSHSPSRRLRLPGPAFAPASLSGQRPRCSLLRLALRGGEPQEGGPRPSPRHGQLQSKSWFPDHSRASTRW